jgi:hypothetical protein
MDGVGAEGVSGAPLNGVRGELGDEDFFTRLETILGGGWMVFALAPLALAAVVDAVDIGTGRRRGGTCGEATLELPAVLTARDDTDSLGGGPGFLVFDGASIATEGFGNGLGLGLDTLDTSISSSSSSLLSITRLRFTAGAAVNFDAG